VFQPNATGATGPDGARGAPGPRGLDGPTGPTGYTGMTGTRVGSTGPVGMVGNRGPTGVTGAMGQVGFTGATGSMGPNGAPAIGATGSIGPQGFNGNTGNTGAMGLPGPDGPIGVGVFIVGPPGSIGPTGLGTIGPAGPTGPATGSIGETGDVGPTGPSFPTAGYTGSTGPTGITGATGKGEPISYTIFPLDSPSLTIISIAEDSAEVFTDTPHSQCYYTIFPFVPGAGSYIDALNHPGILRLTGNTQQLDWNNSLTRPGFIPSHGLNEFSTTLRFNGTPSNPFMNVAVNGYVQFTWFRNVNNVTPFPGVSNGFVAIATITSGIISNWRLQWWSGGIKTSDIVVGLPSLDGNWHDYRFTMPYTADSVSVLIDGVSAGMVSGVAIPFGLVSDDRLAMRWRYNLTGVPGGITPYVDLDRVYLRIRRLNKVPFFP